MHPFRYFMGRAMQIVGLGTMTYVVVMFFSQMSMEPLLLGTLAGASIFYGGTMILGKHQS